MQYKDEFIVEPSANIDPAYDEMRLARLKSGSGERLGSMIAEQFGFSVVEYSDGNKVYKLEFVAWPAYQYHGAIQHLKAALNPQDFEIVIQTLNKIDRLAKINT